MFGATLLSPSIALSSTLAQPAVEDSPTQVEGAGPEDAPKAPESGKDLARRRVAQGQALYEQAEYEEALVAFQDAAAAYASPDFQFNIGLCYERLGETTSAIRAFEAYLRNKPDARDKASVEHRIEELRAELDRVANPPTLPPPDVQAATSRRTGRFAPARGGAIASAQAPRDRGLCAHRRRGGDDDRRWRRLRPHDSAARRTG